MELLKLLPIVGMSHRQLEQGPLFGGVQGGELEEKSCMETIVWWSAGGGEKFK